MFLDGGSGCVAQQWSYNKSKSTELLDHFSRLKPRPRNLSKKIRLVIFFIFFLSSS
ncbi:hypothetical protein EMIT0P228_50073 [Pseudomonas brassicacearum]